MKKIRSQHLAPAHAEALEHRDRVELAAHKRPHAGRDADAADHERDESREAEIHGQLVPEAAHSGLRLRIRRHANVGVGKPGRERILESLGADAGWEAEEHPMTHSAAGADQSGGRQVLCPDHHARPQRKDADGPVGFLSNDAADDEVGVADLHAVTDRGSEPLQQRGMHEGAALAHERLQRGRGLGDQVAIEGIAPRDGLELHDLAFLAGRRHGDQLLDVQDVHTAARHL